MDEYLDFQFSYYYRDNTKTNTLVHVSCTKITLGRSLRS